MVVPPPPADAVAPGLIIQDLIVGRGALAQPGDTIRVHYVAKRLDGSEVDSTRERRLPFEFALGMGAAIRGLDHGVMGMRVGGLRKLTVPVEYSYAEQGREGPASATTIYDVELLRVL